MSSPSSYHFEASSTQAACSLAHDLCVAKHIQTCVVNFDSFARQFDSPIVMPHVRMLIQKLKERGSKIYIASSNAEKGKLYRQLVESFGDPHAIATLIVPSRALKSVEEHARFVENACDDMIDLARGRALIVEVGEKRGAGPEFGSVNPAIVRVNHEVITLEIPFL